MKKIVYIVVGLLLFSGLATIGISEEAGDNQETISLTFSGLKVTDSSIDSFAELTYGGADGCLYEANTPILPMYSTKMTFPFGTKIQGITAQTGQVKSMELSKTIVPAPTPVFVGIENSEGGEYIMDQSIYNSNELYPNEWFEYYTGGGLDKNGDHKTFLILRVFPVRYSPGTDTVNYIEDIQLTVKYKEPETNPFPQTSVYDLVIIAPEAFESELQKLINHKEAMGITTTLKTTEDIYSEFTGFDKPEQIKYFIKDALETWDMSYVLLVGGLNSLLNGKPRDNKNEGTKDWHLPVRYTNTREAQGGTYDPGYISDLYYADIYDGGGGFSSWDSNGDGIYAYWFNQPIKDTIDFYPDVAVGRLPCRNIYEVRILINKIINYETGARGQAWTDKIILVAGDSFDDVGTNYVEGEVIAEYIMQDYMTEYTPVKLYASNKYSNPSMTCDLDNFMREMNKGAGHLFLDGHASPATWTTHPPGEFDEWTERISIYKFPGLFNFKKTPIAAVEGCHNSQFNVSSLVSIADKKNEQHMWTYGQNVPECWSWWLARKIGGGSLATQGNTGLGYGAVGEHGDLDGDGILEEDIAEKLGGFYFLMYYEAMDEGAAMLGDVWVGAETKYQDTHPGMSYQADAKTLEQQAAIGDPSLMIDGYYTTTQFTAEIKDAQAGVLGAPFDEIIFEANSFNGQKPYTYEWDFDNDGQYDDATGKVASWTWYLPGVHWISLKVTDSNGKVDTYDTIVGTEFGASKPTKPTGETNINANVEYTFTTSVNTQSDYWNKVYYMFSWGDGTETDWIESSEASHTWAKKGNYQIKTKAMLTHQTGIDSNDGEDIKISDWSAPLTVSIQKTKSNENQTPFWIQWLQNFFERHPNAFPVIQQLLGL
jgi:hypothetical protein